MALQKLETCIQEGVLVAIMAGPLQHHPTRLDEHAVAISDVRAIENLCDPPCETYRLRPPVGTRRPLRLHFSFLKHVGQ